jgi:virginiamycin B lyase
MKRRLVEHIGHAVLLFGLAAAIALLQGCSGETRPTALPTNAAKTTTCAPTSPDVLGPFYEPDAPQRSSVGEGHVLTGTVRSSIDCSPVSDAQIEIWLAGPDGMYDDAHRATMFSDTSGAYRFESNFPPPYSGRPPHIHIRVTAQGSQELVTQYYPATGQTTGSLDLVLRPESDSASAAEAQPALTQPTTTPSPTSSPPAAPAATETAQSTPDLPPTATETSQSIPTAVPSATATQAPSGTPANFPVSQATSLQEYPVPAGSRPHDVAPAADGSIWYTAQGSGELGRLDPNSGETYHIPLGAGSAPHGVIVGPDGAPWVTDSGLNAIVRVDPATEAVEVFPVPEGSGYANLNTATFDESGVLWFTGQSGIYGRLDPSVGEVEVFPAPHGRGPYGIATTPGGTVYYASLAGSHIARINVESADVTVLEPPTPAQGARRVWPDSQGRVWVSEWNAGQVAVYDPGSGEWREWRLPGDRPQAYAVYVDEQDMVWLSDFGTNALVRFDPVTEEFEVFELPSSPANVRQILGRSGEVWGAESGVDKLVVVRTNP